MNFTQDEIKVLEKEGFKRITATSDEFRKRYDDGDYETVLKIEEDNFEFYYDVSNDADDIDRANGNFSLLNLTRDELFRDFLLINTMEN